MFQTIRYLLLILSLNLIQSCSDGRIDGYTWYKVGVPSSEYIWIQMSQEDIAYICEGPAYGCAFYVPEDTCIVYSMFSEEEAKKAYLAGTFGKTSHFEHEVWNKNKTIGHCAGYMHKEP